MKTMIMSLCTVLLMANLVFAESEKKNCHCKNCTCTKEKHCGCFSEKGCKCTGGSCMGDSNSKDVCQCGNI